MVELLLILVQVVIRPDTAELSVSREIGMWGATNRFVGVRKGGKEMREIARFRMLNHLKTKKFQQKNRYFNTSL